MIVKIGDKFFDSESVPVMVIFSSIEKKLIAEMSPVDMRFCSYPSGMDQKKIEMWMKESAEEI